MGVSEILMGVGIIIPIKMLIQILIKADVIDYSKIECSHELDEEMLVVLLADDIDYTISLAEKLFDKKIDMIALGHDAFEESLLPDIFSKTLNSETALQLEQDMNIYGNKLIFIGHSKSLSPPDVDFSYHLKAPELIYGLVTIIPKIIQIYPILLAMDCKDIEKYFNRTASVWTFTSDCCCCG